MVYGSDSQTGGIAPKGEFNCSKREIESYHQRSQNMKNILLFWITFFLLFPLCHNEMEAISPSSNQTDTMHSQGSRQMSPDLGANLQSLVKMQRALACP